MMERNSRAYLLLEGCILENWPRRAAFVRFSEAFPPASV